MQPLMEESGEQLFERFCSALALRHERIAEAAGDGEQRPDYHVTGTDGTGFVAEVKLVTPNPEEVHEMARVYAGEVVVTGGTPGERMRRLISKANRQLRALGAGKPGVLVVFNPELLLQWHTDPYSILTAMRGLDTIDVHVPADPQQPPVFGAIRSGKAKKMTMTDNRSTSAVICPTEVPNGVWSTDVYHNRFATLPLPIAAIQGSRVSHFRIADDERDWVRHWPAD